MIPDYDYMEELAITVTEENPRYEVKDTIIKSDSFFYVGILPDITVSIFLFAFIINNNFNCFRNWIIFIIL